MIMRIIGLLGPAFVVYAVVTGVSKEVAHYNEQARLEALKPKPQKRVLTDAEVERAWKGMTTSFKRGFIEGAAEK